MLAEMRRSLAGERRLFVATVAGLGAVGACGLVIAKLLDDVLGSDGSTRLDPRILSWVVRQRSEPLTAFARAVTRLGDPWVVTAIAAVGAIVLILIGRSRLAILVGLSTSGAAIATAVAKLVVGRPRPPEALWIVSAPGAAFPSGHATQSVACYGSLAVVALVLVRRGSARVAIAVVAVAVALAVGSSRVYLGVHWPSDVVCGWAVATLWLATLLLIGWAGPRFGSAWVTRR